MVLSILLTMRIFINNYSLSTLIKVIPSIQNYLVETKTKLEIFSDEGEYYIDSFKIYKMNVTDKDSVSYENYYKGFNLLVDYSLATLMETNQIPNGNIEMLSKYYYFALNKSSKLRFVIKSQDDINIIPVDFYFEMDGDVEINNIFLREEINVFLSLLN